MECAKQNLKTEFEHELGQQTFTQTRKIDSLKQQINQLGEQLQQWCATPQHTNTIQHQSPLLPDTSLPPPPPLVQNQGCHFEHNMFMNKSLVEVKDVLNRLMTNQYSVLQETLKMSQSAFKEHYISNAKSCYGKDPKEFGTWLDDVSRLATISSKDSTEVALTTWKGTLHKYISELASSGMGWLPINAQLQERFPESGSSTMVKYKLTQLKHLDLPMHEYTAKFGDMVELAYSIKLMESASQILASNFTEGIKNPNVRNKLRSFQIMNWKDILAMLSKKTRNRKLRVLDFGESSKSEAVLNCQVMAIKGYSCFIYSSDTHILLKSAPWTRMAATCNRGNIKMTRAKQTSVAHPIMPLNHWPICSIT